MKQATLTNSFSLDSSLGGSYSRYLFMVLAGLLAPLGFAPFHIPGLTIISLAFLFFTLLQSTARQAFITGFLFGIGYFGSGVSWVIVSIHDYGQLNYAIAGIATLLFIAYLALFPAAVACIFSRLKKQNKLSGMLLFASLWCLGEFLRAHLFTGFPWLLVGTTQIDTPLRFLAPLTGIFGLSFLTVFLAALLVYACTEKTNRRFLYTIAFLMLLLAPLAGRSYRWTSVQGNPVSIGVVQANLSMRDKWDESLFWKLLDYYSQATIKLLGKQLIILPESAIPLPASYLEDYLTDLHHKAAKAKSALILGILQPTDESEQSFYNAVIGLGMAKGTHQKNHLVPFGEYIPRPFVFINRLLQLPEPNVVPGDATQMPIRVASHPIASLICYEIAYPDLLRKQLPSAEWIVSISDNGWFGRSLASYQQLQMAQMLSLLSGRYQVVVNNDGLSSIVNEKGELLESLPPFSAGILEGSVIPATGRTPWVVLGEYPALLFSACFVFFILFLQVRRNSKQ